MLSYKSGFIAVVGRPNVGKSTLINKIIGQKIAIMSDKPQTTRSRIQCILTQDDAQFIFLDTPGIHKPKFKLGEYMLKAAEGTLKEVDAIFFVIDASEKFGGGEKYIIEKLSATDKPVILVINKIDLLEREKILPIIAEYSERYKFAAIVPISAADGSNVEELLTEAKKFLPEGPKYYSSDMVTDQPERLIIAEIIREKILHVTEDEVPHSVAVDVEEMTERKKSLTYIRAVIYVERDSQKGILIGKDGGFLKNIGKNARPEIEMLIGKKVFLDLWVKVKRGWRNSDGLIKSLGLGE
ncbi:MAG: GTPase Era [Selenomonadaceae bacterium]|nr:GTPase Era [Selenomonadaceae bacterium]